MNSKTIRPQELVANLEILRGRIARKPADYIPQNDYPRSIDDSFSRYTRTHHVNFILSLSDVLRLEFGWPFPFFVLSFSQSKYWLLTAALPIMAWVYVRILLKSMLHRSTEYEVRKAWFANIIDKSMVKLVQLSSRKLFRRWRSTKMLAEHHQELKEIQEIYVKGYWYSCVAAVFPLLDYVCRELLQTENLTKGVGHINKIFTDANICLQSLRPGHAWDYAKKNGAYAQERPDKDLRLVGVALESFLQFAAIYYGHFTQGQDTSVLNRHAVLHGVRGKVWTKEDATKLLLFLDLMINLVPVFEILLAPVPPQESHQ